MEQIDLDSDCEIQEPDGSGAAMLNASVLEISDEGELLEEDCKSPDQNEVSTPIIFEVHFPKNDSFKKYGHTIMTTLQENLKSEQLSFRIGSNKEGNIAIRAFMEAPPTEDVTKIELPPNEIVGAADEKHSSREQSPDYTGLSELFTIDPSPAEKLDTVNVPSYKRAIKDVLDDESSARKKRKLSEKNDCARPRQPNVCFNCSSAAHGLRDCPRPRNNTRINRAKKARSSKLERYHVDVEQRFAHLRPGVISDNLQAALGLRSGELPFFFYRMRILGYPPGWLEEAKVAHSGIMLFNSEGTEVLQSDEDEGEDESSNHKFSISKIIDFPGFNADPGPSFYDDYKHHNVPPLSTQQMKDEFIKSLGDNVIRGYKRRKLKNLSATSIDNSSNNSTLENADMEIEDPEIVSANNVIFTRPLPPPDLPADESQQPPPPPESPPTITPIISPDLPEERSQSPTLADLEAQQEKLRMELEMNTSCTTENEDSLIDEVLALDSNSNTQSDVIASPKREPNSENNSPTPTTPQSMESKIKADIKESHFGTPLLQFSPFDKLPIGDNFKVGVSDVINFENLPDSTGKYEQMKVVIKKVRTIITKLHSADDN